MLKYFKGVYMFTTTVLVVLFVYVVVMVKTGHKRAVKMSEESLRNRFDKGEFSTEARQLMRKVGHKV